MKIGIGIVGLGTVGSGVINIIEKNKKNYKSSFGIEINIIGISAKNKNRKRNFNINKYKWFNNPLDMTTEPNIEVIVELVGGSEGIALDIAKYTLKNKKHLVTANKAMIAKYGFSLFKKAKLNNVNINFEASVAGAIPIISTLQKTLISGKIKNIFGILNGTCNFILTEMRERGLSFNDALKLAQKKGFAEIDPHDDICGNDSAYKLMILSNLVYGVNSKIRDIYIEGITKIEEIDIRMAKKLNYIIILLSISNIKNGRILQRVHPCLIEKKSILAKVNNELNTVVIEDAHADRITLIGKGAGSNPTASAVVSDILNFKENQKRSFNILNKDSNKIKKLDIGARKGNFYLRLMVNDKPGVLADITSFFKSEKVSIKSMFQIPDKNKKIVPLIFITHKIEEQRITFVIKKINKMSQIKNKVILIRIEEI